MFLTGCCQKIKFYNNSDDNKTPGDDRKKKTSLEMMKGEKHPG